MIDKTTSELRTIQSYNLGGITDIWTLDINNFSAYRFNNDKLYNQSFVERVIASSSFSAIDSIEESCFTETYSNNTYKQELNSFIGVLNASTLTNLLYAESKKFLVAFKTIQGRSFIFGSDGGATLSFSQQTGKTGEISGYSVNIIKNSIYPLFEISNIKDITINWVYKPHFDSRLCQILNNKKTGFEIASFITKETKDGRAVDINGDLCSTSKCKQAIHVLEGTANPNKSYYEIESIYPESESQVGGYSILRYNPDKCKIDHNNSIWLNNHEIILGNTTNQIPVTLSSMDDWILKSYPNIAACSLTKGDSGTHSLVFSRKNISGSGMFIFENTRTQQKTGIRVVNNIYTEWILSNGCWKEGMWISTGFWKTNNQ